MLNTGMVIDNRYKILRQLGQGGTSCVYLAENIRLHNYWAIKEVHKNGRAGTGIISNMLVAESSLLTKLRHPGLPSIIDILDTPQSYLIVMEYIEGVSLDKVLAQKGARPQKDVLKWGKQLCDVLTYLHSQQPAIVYRDMKPANVMLKPNGDIVLIDFGMARVFKDQGRHDTDHLGTHGYAAPEQYRNDRQSDARTDIYSLGVTLYHLVTGHDPCLPPYGINSVVSMNPGLSPDLDRIIGKCTRLKPEDRYQTAAQLKNALESVGRAEAEPDGTDPEPEPKSGKWLWCLAVIPVVIVILVAAVIGGIQSTTNRYLDFAEGFGRFLISEIADAGEPTLYFEQFVTISEPDAREYFTFTPEKSGYYDIYSESGSENPVIWLSDGDDNLVDKDNTAGEHTDFLISCWLYKGETYYLETTLYDLDPEVPATGSYWIYIEYDE